MSSPEFDPARFPRTYAPSRGWQAYAWGLSGGIGVIGLVAAWHLWTASEWPTVAARVFVSVDCLLVACAGFVYAWSVLTARLTLGPTFIESRRFGTRRVLRGDILDYRVRTAQAIPAYSLRTSSQARPFTFTLFCAADADFQGWFAGLENADQAALDAEQAAIAGDDRLGGDPSTRLEAAARARRVAHVLSFACMATTFWTFLYPHPYGFLLALNVAGPLLAIGLCARQGRLYTLVERKQTSRGDLSWLVLGPACVLAFRAVVDVVMVQPAVLLVPSAIGGAALGGLSLWACDEMRRHPVMALLSTVFLGGYVASILALGNMLLDRASPRRDPVTIVAMYQTTGKGATSRFTLSKVPEGLASREVRVPPSLYRRKQVGDPVCLVDHEGAFGWHWFRVEDEADCRPD
jgi:hypothetical protein